MKNFKSLIVCFVLLWLVACGGDAAVEPTANPNPASDVAAVEPTAVPAQPTQPAVIVDATAYPAPEAVAEPLPTAEAVAEAYPSDEMAEAESEAIAAEPTAEPAPAVSARQGAFGAGEGSYAGTGTAVLSSDENGNYQVVLSDDFSTNSGPDLFVILSPAANPTSGSAVGDYLKLGELQSITGGQTYALPAGADPQAYQSVVIYCEDFSVVFSAAPLQ